MNRKGFWAEFLGFGTFYSELSVQIIHICLRVSLSLSLSLFLSLTHSLSISDFLLLLSFSNLVQSLILYFILTAIGGVIVSRHKVVTVD